MDNAPYIYYFDNQLQAFVIERADGIDTRVLGKGLMHDVTAVDGPGWSPSGKWFAWTAHHDIAENPERWQKSFLISADGTRQLPLLNDIKYATMVWSPHRDLLLVTSWDQDAGDLHRVIALIDPDENIRHTLMDEHVTFDVGAGDLIPYWTKDGHGIIRYFTEHNVTYLIVNDKGNVTRKAIAKPLFSDDFRIETTDDLTENVAYVEGNNFIVENLLSAASHKSCSFTPSIRMPMVEPVQGRL